MIKITANQVSTSGTSNGQILTSNGTVAYWTTGGTGYTGSAGAGYTGSVGTGYAGSIGSIGYTGSGSAGGGGFSNGQSISVANLAITGSLTVANSVGTSGQALVSTGTGVQWGALSPGYNYSTRFDGSSQYLTTPQNTVFAFGTGDFTIEMWLYTTSSATQRIISINNTTEFVLVNTGSNVYLDFYDGTADNTTGSNYVPQNQWVHVAVSRAGTSLKLFINGVLSGTTTNSANLVSAGVVYIGRFYGSAINYFSGFISNLRIVKGAAVYTAAFTPPTSPLSAISGTSLLTCNAITPTSDSSTNNLAITNNGAVTSTATQSPFTSTTVSIPTASLTAVRQQFTGDGSTTTFAVAGGYTANAISVFVNGVLLRNGTDVTVTNGSTVVFAIAPLNGALIDVIGTVPTTYSSITPVSYSVGFNGSSRLTTPANAAFTFGTGDFTMETWIYQTISSVSNYMIIFQDNLYSAAGGWALYSYNNGLNLWKGGASSVELLAPAGTIPLNSWTHIAWTRNGGSNKLFINGVQVGATVSDSTNYTGTSLVIGSNPTTSYYFSGYMSNLRVVKGSAVYTTNFTPSTTPLSAISGTSLLTCNGPTIIDGSTNAFTITNNGSAPVSTAIVPTFTNVSLTSYPPPTTIGNIPFTTDGTTWTSTQKIVQGTTVATTSGVAIDFTGIPSWVKRITIIFNGVSISGTSYVIVQIGSTTFTTSGYLGSTMGVGSGVATGAIAPTNGFGTTSANGASDNRVGIMHIVNINGNTWISSCTVGLTNAAYGGFGGGVVSLSGVLDRVRLTTVNGTDTFDAGSVNILYE